VTVVRVATVKMSNGVKSASRAAPHIRMPSVRIARLGSTRFRGWLDREEAEVQVDDCGATELLLAAERVIRNWETGDLALAVRELDRVVREVKER